MKTNLIFMLSNAAIFGSWFYIPIFAGSELELNEFSIGMLFAFYGIALLLSSYIFGILADRYGRKQFLFFGFLISTLTFGLQSAAWDFWSLLIIRVAAGFSCGIYPAGLFAYVYEARKKMGKFSSFGSMGFGLGGFSSGIIAQYSDIRFTFVFSSILFLISFFIAARIPGIENIRLKVSFFPIEVIKRNKMVYFSLLLRHSGAHAIWVIYPLYLLELGANLFWIGVIHGTNALFQFIYMFFLTDHYDSRLLVTVGITLSMITFFLFFSVSIWWVFIPLQILLAASWAALFVGSLRYVTEKNIERATASGMLKSILSMSMILGSVVGGTTAYYFGKKNTIIIAFALTVISLVLWYFFELRINRKKNISSA